MAQYCVYGGECNGCMDCYEEKQPVDYCIHADGGWLSKSDYQYPI